MTSHSLIMTASINSQYLHVPYRYLQLSYFYSILIWFVADCVTMSNDRNIRISDGCVNAQIRNGLGTCMHLVIYTNCYTVPFLLLVQYKGDLSEIEFTGTLFSNAGVIFISFLRIYAFLPI